MGREGDPIGRGAGFAAVVKRLLALNRPRDRPFVEMVLLSRNSQDLSLRAFDSIARYSFPSRPVASPADGLLYRTLVRGDIHLFLCNEPDDVGRHDGRNGGMARAIAGQGGGGANEVRTAFDRDAVVFSDMVYIEQGLEVHAPRDR